MPGSAVTAGNGIVLIPIPPGGLTGEVLTKLSNEDYDFDWQPGGGGGGAPTDAEYVVLSLDATLTDERVLTAGTAITIVDGGAGGNVTINVDVATLNPLLDHGLLLGLADDDHTQYLLLAGRAGGQSAFGGTAAGEILALQGSTAANRGEVNLNGRVELDFDWTTDVGSYAIQWSTAIPASGAVIPGMIARSQSVTITAGTFITSTVDDFSVFNQAVAPGFAVNTLFFARPRYETTTVGVAPTQAFIYAAQAQYDNNGGGILPAIANYRALSFAPILRARTAGDDLRVTNTTGVSVQPLYNTNNATATVDYGTIRGTHMLNAGTILFGQALGSEIADNWIGLDVEALTGLTVSGVRAAVRSALPISGTSNFLIQNLSTAPSDFAAGLIHLNDSSPIQFGGGVNTQDVSIFWNPTGFLQTFFASTSDSLQWTSPAADRFLLESNSLTGNELNLNFELMSFGSAGAVGNQAFTFEQNARTVTVAGGYVSVNFTASGNLNLGVLAMSDVGAWNVNSLAFDNTAYSITDLYTFNVGGMTTSNPGGTVTRRHALRVTGRHTQRGTTSYETIAPAALAAGDNDDWAGLLTGSPNNNTREWARITGNATTSIITGIDSSAVQNDQYTLTNVGSETILLANQDTGSLAANRIITPDGNNYVLSENRSAQLRYDDTDSRWRIISPPAAVATLGGEWQFDNNTTMADPGDGNFRNNNGTIGSVTAIAIADETKPGNDAGNILAAIASGDQLYLQNLEDASEFLVFDVTSNTDNTGWHQIGGTVNASGGNFTDGKEFLITVFFA